MRCKVWKTTLFMGKSGYKKRYRKRHDCIIYGICYGKSTARGYNAPYFEGVVHYHMGSVLMHRDKEDRKDNVKSAYRTV